MVPNLLMAVIVLVIERMRVMIYAMLMKIFHFRYPSSRMMQYHVCCQLLPLTTRWTENGGRVGKTGKRKLRCGSCKGKSLIAQGPTRKTCNEMSSTVGRISPKNSISSTLWFIALMLTN